MKSSDIRKAFLDFFSGKGHQIVPSAPLVVRNDPTLMFTNAGMNQFKDIFLGHARSEHPRVANTQKCLRVSGKHNDLEEVGHDTCHHTMFEMLGNWSFGDYFKKEAIDWAWEFLTERMGISPDRMYATVFEGDAADGLEWDKEAWDCWHRHLKQERILKGSRKDNFWEMGDTGPCGPCSEIHVDIRPENERKKTDGRALVNKNHPLVLEIWNLVFIQYNRKADGRLEALPQKHVDTGLGFERLCMALQDKTSNYDTDLFQPVIQSLSAITGHSYGKHPETDVAMRVAADHLRAVAFAIADGQLPSNTKAGYVIRRILRRAVRYGYTFLDQSEPFLHRLVPVLTETMGKAFPELPSQQETIARVILEEENSFLKTLDTGIRMLDQHIASAREKGTSVISGKSAFILYDTYGFPFDLTQLILREHQMTVDQKEFEKEMAGQKLRSKDDAVVQAKDWIVLQEGKNTEFTGYDRLEDEVQIIKYRTVSRKGKNHYQLVFDRTPFYAESGGQVGDRGYITRGSEKILVTDTQKENELILHVADRLPEQPGEVYQAVVTAGARLDTAANHTATHLLHYALRKVLGTHVEQKGSLVHPEYLRFDFSHFSKLSGEEIISIETLVNELIRKNILLEEKRSLPIREAKKMGALAFFGEKYGNEVRVIRFGDSVELCGGTHVKATGDIGFFKIIKESAIAAGIRRIEARSGRGAESYIHQVEDMMHHVESLVKSPDLAVAVEKIIAENSQLRKQYDELSGQVRETVRQSLLSEAERTGEITLIARQVALNSPENIKTLAFELKNQVTNLVLILGASINGKAHLTLMISENLVNDKGIDAVKIIREIAPHIKGGGGGQAFFATAGGSDPEGIPLALEAAVKLLKRSLIL
jgi:alanyl-tRNA synthetase